MGRYDKIKSYNNSSWGQPTQMRFKPYTFPIRYIYVYQNGSNVNTGNHLCQVEAYDITGVNVAVGATVTGSSAVTNPQNCVKATLDTSYSEIAGGSRQWFIIDLGKEYMLQNVKVWRYYPGGRTYYETAICCLNANKSIEARIHVYDQQGLYAESSTGYDGTWLSLGINDSSITRTLSVYENGTWVRKTLNRKVTYGRKYLWNNSGGYGRFDGGSAYNLNQNTFDFQAWCRKDSNGDRYVASFGSNGSPDGAGWHICWLADGRIRWKTRYSSNVYSYSSNSIMAWNWSEVRVVFTGTGTGTGTLWHNGVASVANRSGRHEYSSLALNVGSYGMFFYNYIRAKGKSYGGSNYGVERIAYINNCQVTSGNQYITNMNIYNSVVTQTETVTWE